ncbi:PH and SEC7 domain-containing protein-like [Oppia nitens]|uniref:PH and SEC7 domain-containing protein-like n=1 Tax=Oppia nitens TaxID=1686743 RepID=UPI0023D9D20A|nr:PH and SEC7 domain-containing protein-like [Oppia nitens]
MSSSTATRHQDWFMMTGDLIINLTNTKSGESYRQKNNLRLKSAPNLMPSSRLERNNKEFNSEPTTPSREDISNSDISVNHRNGGSSEHKETQTLVSGNHMMIEESDSYHYNNEDVMNDFINKRQMSLPLVRFHKSDDHLLAANNLSSAMDINCAEDCCSHSLTTMLSDRQLTDSSKTSSNSSPDNCDHNFNEDEQLLLSNNSSSNKSSPNDCQSLSTSSSANISPTKTLTFNTIDHTEQTESSMSENYSLISSISCQTIDQSRHKSKTKNNNQMNTSLSSSFSDENSSTPSISPEDQLLRNNLEDFDCSYNELKGGVKELNGYYDRKIGANYVYSNNNSSNMNINHNNHINDNIYNNYNNNNKLVNGSIVTKSNQLIDIKRNGLTTGQQLHTIGGSDEESSDTESNYSPPKGVDTPSAIRLAKRLYNLEGFKKSDVSRHLCKNNEFSRVVAEEYLKYFDFTDDTLDLALKKFLSNFCLIGETQERERVLVHFSKRFYEYNQNGSFRSNDAIHTLTCALMLLNTDLHGENVGRKMTCNEFVQNLSGMNEGYDFPRDCLRQLYQAIKDSPLQWDSNENSSTDKTPIDVLAANLSQQVSIIGHNPFLEVPNPNSATEYKKGYVMRKSCYESNGKKTPVGKRGWKMFYATLRDLILYLHKDEQGFRKNQLYESLNNSIRVHHALASNASDYTKKQFVFRLLTADHSEYLFQTSDSRELQSWIDTINTVAASLSAPPLPEAVGSDVRKFQRPLLPVSHTKYNLCDQLLDHERRVERLESQLNQLLSKTPQKKTSKRQLSDFAEQQSYLQYELKRYIIYVSAMKSKLSQLNLLNNLNSTQMISSSAAQPLLSTAIGEETGDDTNDTPIITTFKKNYSSDR